MSFKTAIVPALVTVLLAAPAGSALAQDMQSPEAEAPAGQTQQLQVPGMEAPTAADFSDDQIALFAEAFLQIREIGMGYEQSIQGAADEEERNALIQEAEAKMTAVIEGTEGLTVPEYNRINAAASADPEFAQRVKTEIDAQMS